MKKSLLMAFSAIAMAACANNPKHVEFTATDIVNPADTNLEYAIVDFISGDTLTVATAADGKVTYALSLDAPTLAVISHNGQVSQIVAIENGEISLHNEDGFVHGGKYNDEFAEFLKAFRQGDADQATLLHNFVRDHADNPYSLYLYGLIRTDLTLEELDQLALHFPALKENKQFIAVRNAVSGTGPGYEGNPYINFTVGEQSLSDYIHEGQYTIVDFWAPWCGPCRREMPTLQQLWADYKDKGLTVVGVDVWQKEGMSAPDCIKQMGITYPIIYDAPNSVPDSYGILGIPCILVIDGNGTIVARDKRGEELVEFISSLYK